MDRCTCLLAAGLLLGSQAAALLPAAEGREPRKAPADGVYRVLRDGPTEKSILPFKDGETLVVNRHRYQKEGDKEAPQFLAVHDKPEVPLDLAGGPEADRENGAVVRIRMKLRPDAAKALERVTRDRQGQLAIVLGGEVVTVHKIRTAIPDGNVQITSCSPGAADYLLKQLEARPKGK
jgi:hypothetical protein